MLEFYSNKKSILLITNLKCSIPNYFYFEQCLNGRTLNLNYIQPSPNASQTRSPEPGYGTVPGRSGLAQIKIQFAPTSEWLPKVRHSNLWSLSSGARTQGKFNTHKFSARGREIHRKKVRETGKIDLHLPGLPGNVDSKEDVRDGVFLGLFDWKLIFSLLILI